MSERSLPGLSLLDTLRPSGGWQTNLAVFSTYTLDLTVGVACLLALAGLDDERGSGSKVDLVHALESLRGKAKFLVQAGRVKVPARSQVVLRLLDRFVKEQQFDERNSSWHAKAALIRYTEEDSQEVEWRFWISSRNLTKDVSWDMGLLLVGHPNGEGHPIRGARKTALSLLRRAELEGMDLTSWDNELRRVHWQSPPGLIVEDIRLSTPENPHGLPKAPEGLQQLAVISPFLDGGTVKELSRWGDADTKRQILSTLPELRKLKAQSGRPLKNYEAVLALEEPSAETLALPSAANDAQEQAPPSGEPATQDDLEEHRGLHAKAIMATHQDGCTLWLGSANLTKRAWDGGNVELILKTSIEEDVQAGLALFLSSIARVVDIKTLEQPVKPEPELDALDRARHEVAARWPVVQRIHDGCLSLVADGPVHPSNTAITLSVAPVGASWVEWPRATPQLALGSVKRGEESELLAVRLSLDGYVVDWVQHTRLDPPLDLQRDDLAIARYLDPKAFFDWIRSILVGEHLSEGGGEWDASPRKGAGKPAPSDRRLPWMPTLEETLRAWSRQPDSVASADWKISHYLARMAEQSFDDLSDGEKAQLAEFQKTWNVIREVLRTQTEAPA